MDDFLPNQFCQQMLNTGAMHKMDPNIRVLLKYNYYLHKALKMPLSPLKVY